MDDSISTSGSLEGFTGRYIRRLLIERRYIYAKLYNPGGSVILRASDVVDHDRPIGYSTDIGNTFHLDLIQLDQEIRQLVRDESISRKELGALLTWADGLNATEAAEYLNATGSVSVRKNRERALRKVQERLDAGQGQESGRAS